MDNVTITIFVSSDSFVPLMNILTTLEKLPLENNYTFQPLDIIFSEYTISNYLRINIPIELYLKFKYLYKKLKN